MKYKIYYWLHQFAGWLWTKTHRVSATEIILMREAENTICSHCGQNPFD